VRFEFADCGRANDGLSSLGFEAKGTQLEGGELKGCFEANRIGSAFFLSAFLSKRTLFTGQKMPGMSTFCFMASGDSYYQGGSSYGGDLCGYKAGVPDMHCAWNGRLCSTYLPAGEFKAYLLQCGAHNAYERFTETFSTQLCGAGVQLMQRQFEQGLNGQLKSDAQVFSLLATLLEQAETPRPAEEGCRNLPLLREFVQFAHDNAANEPLTLAEVSQMLHVGSSTLKRACTDAYGMSVIGLMRQVRLEQCRLSFLKPEPGATVDSVRKKYRFTTKSRFARMYKESFGELPSESFMRGQGQLRIKGI